MPTNAGVNTGAGHVHVGEGDAGFESADLDADSDAGDGDACNSSGRYIVVAKFLLKCCYKKN